MINEQLQFTSMEDELQYFHGEREKRGHCHAQHQLALPPLDASLTHSLATLQRDGVVVLKNFLPRAPLRVLLQALEQMAQTGHRLSPPRDLRNYQPQEDYRHVPRLEIGGAGGRDFFRERTNTLDMAMPLVNCPEILSVALEERLLAFVGSYLRCLPALTYVKFRCSLRNQLPDFDTNLFHFDGGTARPVRVFLYLNEVDSDSGPFSYVRGSHRNRFPLWHTKDRWTEEEICQFYPPEDILELTAAAGDVIIADNAGYHRGKKPTAQDRFALLLTYGAHREYAGGSPPVIARGALEKLEPRNRAVLDLLDVAHEK